MSTIIISDMPERNTLLDTTYFATETGDVTEKISAETLKNYLSGLEQITTTGNIAASGTITANVMGSTTSELFGILQTPAQPMVTSVGTLNNLRVSGDILRDGIHLVPSAVNVATFAAINATPIGNATASSGSFTAINGTRLSIQGDSDLNSVTGSTITGLVLRASIALIPTANVSTNLGDSALWWRQAWVRDLAVENIDVSKSLLPSVTNTADLGSPTKKFRKIYGISSESQYADLAEIYAADAGYSPGTVVVFGGSAEITQCQVDHDPAVAGVISTAPGYLLNSGATGLPLALSGRVPCRVTGPVNQGERLVTGADGTAQALVEQKYRPGCVIGHSLATVPAGETHTVEVVIMKY